MNTQRFRWFLGTLLFVVSLAPLIAGSTPSTTLASPPEPIWGTKPVLAYFLLTSGVSEQLQADLGLSQAQFEAIFTVAQHEAMQLQALDQASQPVLQDAKLSIAEKRSQMAASGYNQQMATILAGSQQELQQSLGEALYKRLVAWIERRWALERQLHGMSQPAANPRPDLSAAPQAARSYKVYATRYDSNGAYTVAIPDKCLKFANGGSHICDSAGYKVGAGYAVKVQYESNSPVRVTVGETGPWNVDDNFWATTADPQPRRQFTDLPLGMPEAQAAYFDNYNGGLDQFGRKVTSPVAIDLSKQVNADLGLGEHQNAWVNVTYLWTSDWADSPGESQAVTINVPTKLHPGYSGDMCGSHWHKIQGLNGEAAYLTLNVNDAAQSSNWAEWIPELPMDGKYKVEAFIPSHSPVSWQCPALDIPHDTSDARYTINYAGGQTTVKRNQGPVDNLWMDLGTYEFNAGNSGSVKLVDLNGETNLSHTISFSAMRFTLLNPPTATPRPLPTLRPTSTPVPSPTPSPTPTGPLVRAGKGSAEVNASVDVPIEALNLTSPGLGQATIDVNYDPAVVNATACLANPNAAFTSGQCDLNYNRDGVYPDTVRFNITAASGVTTDSLLASVTFQAVGKPFARSLLGVLPVAFIDANGTNMPVTGLDGLVCVTACEVKLYLPMTGNEYLLIP